MIPINTNLLKMFWDFVLGKQTNYYLVILLVRGKDGYDIVRNSIHSSEELALERIEEIADECGGHFEWYEEFGYNTLWNYDRTFGIQLYCEEHNGRKETQHMD